MQITLSELREGTRQRADMTFDSDAIDDLEVNGYVQDAWEEVHELVTANDEARRFTINATKLPPIGDHSFQLPEDYDRLVSLHVLRNNTYIPGLPADPSRYAELADNWDDYNAPRYFVRENPSTGTASVFVFPAPTTDTLALTYWPRPKQLSLDSDYLGIPRSWAEFIQVAGGIRLLDKVERDASALLLAKQQIQKRIIKSVQASDFNSPRMIRDVSYRYGYGGYRW